MTSRTWNGTTGSFDDASKWSPTGVPASGDTATIASATVTATADTLTGLTISLPGGTSSTLKVVGGSLASSSTLTMGGSLATFDIAGAYSLAGILNMAGSITATPRLSLEAGATLTNTGTINLTSSGLIYSVANNTTSAIVNNGLFDIIDLPAGSQSVIVSTPISGTGTIRLENEGRIDFQRPVGSGQTIEFAPGAKNAILQDDSPATLSAAILGFVATDIISLSNLVQTSISYTSTSATSGSLTLTGASGIVATLKMSGVYQASDFALAFYDFGGGKTNTSITTTATTPTVFYTNSATGTNGSALATLYSGPVSYLQWQYLWSGTDGVAMSATAPNVFLHGGAGSDALQVTSGQNVLDGGGGSNFLVGGTGAGSADTFYVDGTSGQSTWSTLVNFHAGDSATIFGFNPGTSTLPWTASDGAAGYTGATIHSELGGLGTGANGSITFAGVDLNTANAYFDITSGNIGTIGYLLIQYNATPHVSYTDTVTNTSSTALATAYTGPVAGLQWQYLWSGSDGVAISAAMPNVFLHGGSGSDALAVTGGVNVLDGGGGSNFLVGGTGAGSQDTFFVDGTSGENTWSTIVNFHLGDSATIFGFNPGVSTLPWTPSDGAAGYTGATIHSELGGPGTGANGSITFAGIDLATANAHFTITSGTIGGTTGYLLIQYDH